MTLATIEHHSGVSVSVKEPVVGLANLVLTVGEAIHIDLPLDAAELKVLRDGIDKAISQIRASGWHENIRGPEYYKQP